MSSFDIDLSEFAAEVYASMYWNVQIYKAGGGTVGKEYTGDWSARCISGHYSDADDAICYGGEGSILMDVNFRVGIPVTHAEACRMAAEWAEYKLGM